MKKIENLFFSLVKFVDKEFVLEKRLLFDVKDLSKIIKVLEFYDVLICGGNIYYRKGNEILNIDSIEGLFVYNWSYEGNSRKDSYHFLTENVQKIVELEIGEKVYFELFSDCFESLYILLDAYDLVQKNYFIEKFLFYYIKNQYSFKLSNLICLKDTNSFSFIFTNCLIESRNVSYIDKSLGARLNGSVDVGFFIHVEDGYLRKIEGYTFYEDWPEKINSVEFFEIEEL